MGFAISWLGVKGEPADTVAHNLCLERTGEVTDYAESLFTGRTLSNGWFLLVIDECGHGFAAPASLAALSSDCEVIACSIEEHIGFCSSELWRNGTRVWFVEHDGEKGVEHLRYFGVPPDAFWAIEKERSSRQDDADGTTADVDYFFEIPLLTAKSIVGFMHDEANRELNDDFEVFKSVPDSSTTSRSSAQVKKPWWKLW
ncbi:MAG: hypothetical protein LC772_09195 [Chloroflexi bacterium]|nr:hypothetical protein [Chloroflexota bacterium]